MRSIALRAYARALVHEVYRRIALARPFYRTRLRCLALIRQRKIAERMNGNCEWDQWAGFGDALNAGEVGWNYGDALHAQADNGSGVCLSRTPPRNFQARKFPPSRKGRVELDREMPSRPSPIFPCEPQWDEASRRTTEAGPDVSGLAGACDGAPPV